MVQRDLEYFSATDGGMVSRAITRISPTTRMMSTTATEMSTTTTKWSSVTGTPLVRAKSSS
ncbi:hypothetical protein SDC9_152801 [bioreactor metagenome]|uniref:Uncharacterized protein n=1 Tax=bioreactor metagenome TaxID=1076179 RepID=A0A645EVT4_9ZZZZ